MKVILWKILKDFRHAKGKLSLMILAASLSAWGISSVTYSYFLTERDFEMNFMQTDPADLSIVIDDYADGLEEELLKDEQIIDIERREAVGARIKSADGSWMPVMIYAIEEVGAMRFDRINILDKEDRAPGNFIIEKNAFFYLSEGQQQVELMFQGNDEIVKWDLAGKAHDARQAPARMEGMVYAYTTSIDKLTPYLEQGRRRLLIETNVSTDKEQLVAIGERLTAICEQHGAKVRGVSIPTPGEHIHQGIVDGISFLQKSGGAILSVMGIILLSLILLTWLVPQLPSVGVMKAIGASTRHILTSYTLTLMGIITVGMMVGLPFGYKTASVYAGAVAFFQNFEVVSDLLPIIYHVLVVMLCMVIPMVFGFFPLFNGSRTSVNDALNRTFYISQKGIFKLSQRLISNVSLKYSLNNLFRQGARTALTMLLLAVGVALYFTAANVAHSIRKDLRAFAQSTEYDIVVSLPEKMDKASVSFLSELPEVVKISGMVTQRVTFVPPNLSNPETSFVRTLSPDFDIDDDLVRRGSIDKTCTDCVYVGSEEMSESFDGVALGSVIELKSLTGEKSTYKFSGVVEDMVILGVPFLVFDQEASDSFDGLAFDLTPGLSDAEASQASNAIDDLFIDNGINISALQSTSRRIGAILAHLDPTFLIIRYTGIFTIVLGLFGLLIVLKLTIEERTREIGIMKSMGAPFRKVSGIFKQEFVLMSLMAIVFGGILALPIASALIGVIAETVIRHPVALASDNYTFVVTLIVILVTQTILISIYNRFKIGSNTRELMEYNF